MTNPKAINCELLAVKQSGDVNMLDMQQVHDVAQANGLTELSAATNDVKDYAKTLMSYVPPTSADYQKWHDKQEVIVGIAQEILHQNDD